ncbi:MAG: methyltransferase domain-containing protein [Gammaproteobacteria bacterium]|jgi:malonyl-CoA O-methyltransferase|nr:methyltransferase domain-containing protein [Gammaproteobacteria bacterium]
MIDQLRIRHAFTRAAAGFDAGDFLHREVRERLLDRLQAVTAEPARIIDLGAGTGAATPGLQSRFPAAHILSIDSSAAMLTAGSAVQHGLCADAAHLPLVDDCADMVVSNLMLHHCPDPVAVLTEARRVLSTQGFLVLTTFGRKSLLQLGRGWASADQFTHISPFFDLQELGNLLTATGFTEPVLDIQTLTVTYDTLEKIMVDLRSAGSTNATDGRNRGLTGRNTWSRFAAAYDQLRESDGKLPVTLEIIFTLAWAGKYREDSNEIEIPVEAIGKLNHGPSN